MVYNSTVPWTHWSLLENVLTWGRNVFSFTVSWEGCVEHEFILFNLTSELEKLSSEIRGARHELQGSLNSLANAVSDKRITLVYILAAEGGV